MTLLISQKSINLVDGEYSTISFNLILSLEENLGIDFNTVKENAKGGSCADFYWINLLGQKS